MLGRGLVARPSLANEIQGSSALEKWENLDIFFVQFLKMSRNWKDEKYAVTRIKQLSKLLARTYSEAQDLFQSIKRLQEFSEVLYALERGFRRVRPSALTKDDHPGMIL